MGIFWITNKLRIEQLLCKDYLLVPCLLTDMNSSSPGVPPSHTGKDDLVHFCQRKLIPHSLFCRDWHLRSFCYGHNAIWSLWASSVLFKRANIDPFQSLCSTLRYVNPKACDYFDKQRFASILGRIHLGTYLQLSSVCLNYNIVFMSRRDGGQI